MPNPIVFISRNRIKDGKVDDFRKHYQASVPPVEAGKPGTLVQVGFESEDSTEFIVIRLFPDAAALDAQLAGASDRSKKTYEFIEPTSVEIYGTPSPATVEALIKIAGSGIIVNIYPQYIGGFIRSRANVSQIQ